jgi:hypothetical protein
LLLQKKPVRFASVRSCAPHILPPAAQAAPLDPLRLFERTARFDFEYVAAISSFLALYAQGLLPDMFRCLERAGRFDFEYVARTTTTPGLAAQPSPP